MAGICAAGRGSLVESAAVVQTTGPGARPAPVASGAVRSVRGPVRSARANAGFVSATVSWSDSKPGGAVPISDYRVKAAGEAGLLMAADARSGSVQSTGHPARARLVLRRAGLRRAVLGRAL